jgi:hypothetical protein
MPITLNGDSGITTPTYGGAVAAEYIAPVTSFKNRIINGAMQIDQRNAGASVGTASGSSVYITDRWFVAYTQTSKMTGQQNAGSVTPPTGFTNYLGITSSSAYSVLTGDSFGLFHRVEGFNVSDLGWGTANAATVTLSFWVRSSLTGTFGGSLQNNAADRSYPFTYTISAANTWEQKSITIAGDTTGTWVTNNGLGIQIVFGLGSGSTFSGTANAWVAGNLRTATGATSVVGTSGATFYITGVQLEKGSNATSFDYRPYGTELALCQRYYQVFALGSLQGNNRYPNVNLGAGNLSPTFTFPVVMRSAPSTPTVTAFFDTWSATGGTSYTLRASTTVSGTTFAYASTDNGGSFLGSGNFGFNTTSALTLNSEL